MTRSGGHIFLSYSRPNRAVAAALAAELSRSGWNVWWDREILPGHQFDQVIAAQLKEAACVVVLWSSDSIASPYVRDEARHALKRNVLVPVLIERVDPPLGFGEHHTASLVGWTGTVPDDQLDMLKRGIAHHVKPALTTDAIDASLARLPGDHRKPLGGHEPSSGAARLFMCRRRSDVGELATELCDALGGIYGTDAVSMDVAGDWPPQRQDRDEAVLSMCRAVLVVMGPGWSSARDGKGNRKLDDPADHVRREIAAAIRQRLPLLPILVDDAQFPPPDLLPADIRALCQYDRVHLRSLYWKHDIQWLISKLDRVMSW